MNNRLLKFIAVGILFLAGTTLWANEGIEYHYFDGDKRITIFLQPDLLAIFSRSQSQSETKARSVDASARLLATGSEVHIFRISDKGAVDSLRQGVVPGALKTDGSASPVFSDARSGGIKRALPGGVIVSLNPVWDDKQVATWANSLGLEIIQKLNITGNYYALKTAAGIQSLLKANELKARPEVLLALPNWWSEYSHR
ncbi:MAG: hypothetical protein HS115_01700 [Spirochaetales bacterium]|nr:hypothetical protein [Spirochaetales bacterium]